MIYNKIVILGSKGMLGQMVCSYFKNKSYEIIIFDDYFSENNIRDFIDKLNIIEDAIIINCIGRIKQKSSDLNHLLWSNTILPLELSRSLKDTHLLIHPSTDCVFKGNVSDYYSKSHIHDAEDIYGWSKSLGEIAISKIPNSIILRVSIIGPDKYSDKGLLSWFLNNADNSTLNGYSEHYWNGITTLEWCIQLLNILENDKLLKKCIEKKIIQLGTKKRYSKYEMLSIFNKKYKKNCFIKSLKTEPLNRCLQPEIYSKPLEIQIDELINFFVLK